MYTGILILAVDLKAAKKSTKREKYDCPYLYFFLYVFIEAVGPL